MSFRIDPLTSHILVVRFVTAVVYGLLLALTLPAFRREFERSFEQFQELHRRLRGRRLTIFDAWRRRYYLPESVNVPFEEQVKRVSLASVVTTASLGLLTVGLSFAFDLPPDRAIWVPPMGGVVMSALGAIGVPLMQRAGRRLGKPLEPIEEEVPTPSRFETLPTKSWLILGVTCTIAGFTSATLVSNFLQPR